MSYVAQGTYVLLRLGPKTDEELASGLVVPAGSAPQALAEVVSAGPDAYSDIEPGRTVLFQPYRAVHSWRESTDEVMLVVLDEDIYAVIEDEKLEGRDA